MTRDDYSGFAPWYDLFIDPFTRGLRPTGFKLFQAAGGMRMLEIGCGTGTQLGFYRARGCRATGIDLSAAMLRIVRLRRGGAPPVCQADGARLPHPDAVFQRVLATLVLHEMAPDVRVAVLDEMIRVLHPAGCLGVIDYHPEPRRSLKGRLARRVIQGIERSAGRRHYRHYRHFVESGGIPALARRKGLRIECCHRSAGGNIGIYRLGRENAASGI